ncbi:MAG: hypothetical protein QG608_3224 [Actinomycetota bacterium]|nr:hypothetical protein [Actinomycetota bacterium]
MKWRYRCSVALHGRTVRVLTAGSATDRCPVILLGGLASPAADWEAVLDHLAPRTQVIWCEGIRPTGRPREQGTPVRTTAALVHDTARALGLPEPWLLVGHSLGGLYAQGFARLYPEVTAGLVLVDSTLSARPARRPWPRARRAAREFGWGIVRWLLVETGGAVVFGRLVRRAGVWGQTLHGRDRLPADDADRLYRDRRSVASLLGEGTASARAATELHDLATTHPFPDRPVTVLVAARHGRPWTRRDTTWVRAQRRLAALTSTTRFVVLDEAAHLVMLDQPQAVADAVIQTI